MAEEDIFEENGSGVNVVGTFEETVERDEFPLGVFAINLSPSDQKLFEVVAEENVTARNPIKFISVAAMMRDLKEREDISPFYDLKDEISGLTEDVIISYDPDRFYGEDYFICLSEGAKNWILSKIGKTESPQQADEKSVAMLSEETLLEPEVVEMEVIDEKEEFFDVTSDCGYNPPKPKEWISRGSEKEITDENVVEKRRKITVTFQKPLQFYDPKRELVLTTRLVSDYKQGYMEMKPYEDPNFGLQMMEMDKASQAANMTTDNFAQTTYLYPRNVWVQTLPRELSEEELEEQLQSEKMEQFFTKVLPRLDLVLQQNELFDVFIPDWENMGEVDINLHGRQSGQIKEYQSFSDLQFSKDKMVTCIQWHPTIFGLIAVACADRLTFETRVERGSKLLMQNNLVLLWSIKDPIHPQLLLEAPEEVQCFSFNPLIPHLAAGGCSNGQILLWDFSEQMEKLKEQTTVGMAKKHTLFQEAKFVNGALNVPSIRYAASSNIEHGHKASVEDIAWVPDHFEIGKSGYSTTSTSQFCIQLMSCGLDCMIHVWDIRLDKQLPLDTKSRTRDKEYPLGLPTTFQFLDTVWRPVHSCDLIAADGNYKLISMRFAFHEMQTYRLPSQPFDMGLTICTPPDSTEKLTIDTRVFIGTMTGNIAGLSWVHEKDADGKMVAQPAIFSEQVHGGPVTTVEYSPFSRSVVLTVGLWRFAIWHEEHPNDPILQHHSLSRRLLAGKWSETRPSVFFIAKEDGTLDVWDLNDRSHEPVLNHSVSAAPLSTIHLHPRPQSAKDYMLAIADNVGTLHLLILPTYLMYPLANELNTLTEFIESEVECLQHRKERGLHHAKTKMASAAAQAKQEEKGMFVGATETATTMEDVMYEMYRDYLKLENECFIKLGMVGSVKSLSADIIK